MQLAPSLLLLLTAVASCARPGARAATPVRTPAHPPTTLTYLGVAGWKLASSAGTLLFDPYVTRAAVDDDSAPLVPDEVAIAAYTPARVDAVLVGHSHYDHVLDVPTIARRTGAIVVGTESTANLVTAGGVPATQLRVARGGETFALGPFTVRAVAALHSLTGQTNAPIPRAIALPLPARAYEEGSTLQYLVRFEGRSIFFVGTANFIDEEVRGLRPDIAIVAIGLRHKIPDYTCRLLHALGRPAVVLPNHFDAFREPLRPRQMEPDAGARAELDAFTAEVHSCAPGTRTEVPVHLRAIVF